MIHRITILHLNDFLPRLSNYLDLFLLLLVTWTLNDQVKRNI